MVPLPDLSGLKHEFLAALVARPHKVPMLVDGDVIVGVGRLK